MGPIRPILTGPAAEAALAMKNIVTNRRMGFLINSLLLHIEEIIRPHLRNVLSAHQWTV
jgi:hypothetical protein